MVNSKLQAGKCNSFGAEDKFSTLLKLFPSSYNPLKREVRFMLGKHKPHVDGE